MTTRILFGLVALAGLAACQSSTGVSDSEKLRQLSREPVPNAMALAQTIPGFGGYWLDAEGMPAVYLTDAAQRPLAAAALAGFLAARGFSQSDLRVLPGRYDYLQLEAWRRSANPQVLTIPGAVFSDLDEAANVVRFGLANDAAVAIAANTVAQLGIPADAVVVEKATPVELMQGRTTLQSGRARPVIAGYQINFFHDVPVRPASLLCTLGFNAFKGGERSFVTNSHCSNIEGNTSTPTRYYQPTLGPAENFIAVEADDPPAQTVATNPECPGLPCRYSDASRAAYNADVPSDLARIARTQERDASVGTLNVDTERFFRITGKQADSVVGEKVNKVGRTTGWTFGRVTGTCQDVVATGATYVRMCSTRTDAGVNSGDSGSPAFALNDGADGEDATLLGIVWGGSSGGGGMIFSPMSGVERELGELQVHE
jgi:hypothetical protein